MRARRRFSRPARDDFSLAEHLSSLPSVRLSYRNDFLYDMIFSLSLSVCVLFGGDTGPGPGACLGNVGRTFLNDLKQPLRLRLRTALALAEM